MKTLVEYVWIGGNNCLRGKKKSYGWRSKFRS